MELKELKLNTKFEYDGTFYCLFHSFTSLLRHTARRVTHQRSREDRCERINVEQTRNERGENRYNFIRIQMLEDRRKYFCIKKNISFPFSTFFRRHIHQLLDA